MKRFILSRPLLIGIALLLATNITTGLITAWKVRSHDFSEMNINCLLNWGGINSQFEDAKVRTLPHPFPQTEAEVYRIHEDNARFLVHYPKFNHRLGLDRNRPLILFCWAVAADRYHYENVDIPVDPDVWQAFLADGPKSLPIYWNLRQSLSHAGAGHGLIRGSDMELAPGPKPPPYRMGPSKPYQPLPGEAAPS